MEHPNAYITYSGSFIANALLENKLFPTQYTVKLTLLPQDTDYHHAEVCHNRLDVVFHDMLNNSIFIKSDDEIGHVLYVTHNKIVDFWDIPHEHNVAKALFYKINAILDGYMILDTVELSSTVMHPMSLSFSGFLDDENMVNMIDDDYNWKKHFAGTEYKQPWWFRNDTTTTNIISEDEDDELVLTDFNLTWEDHGLEWEETTPNHNVATIINFNRPFTPEIIPGGKDDDV